MQRKICRVYSGILGSVIISISSAYAENYTFTPSSGTDIYNWSEGDGWSAMPVSGSDTTLTLGSNATVFSAGAKPALVNDLGSFTLNSLVLNGKGISGSTTGYSLSGGDLVLVSNGGVGPSIQLNADRSGSTLDYGISNNLIVNENFSITGNGLASSDVRVGFNFTGYLIGNGSLTKTGSSIAKFSSASTDYLHSGNITVSGGRLIFGNGSNIIAFLSRGGLEIGAGAAFDVVSNVSFTSLSGSGSLVGTAGSNRTLNLNAYEDQIFNGVVRDLVSINHIGGSNLTIGRFEGNSASLLSGGSGFISAESVLSNQGALTISNQLGTIKVSGTSGIVTGGAVSNFNGGTVWIAPKTVSETADIVVQGMTSVANGNGAFRATGGVNLVLEKGGNQSLTYVIGTGTDAANFILTRGGSVGNLVIDPVDGSSALGDSVKFVLNGGKAMTLSNGLVNTAFVGVDNDTQKSGDFLTYVGSQTASDVGFRKATYSHTFSTVDSFTGTSATSVVHNSAAQLLSDDTQAFALRNDATITVAGGKTLRIGNPGTGEGQATQAGLILNGGTITGSGTLAFGNAEATIYTSKNNGTLDLTITSSGTYNNGFSSNAANSVVSLTKFGEGTLTLGKTAGVTGAVVINEGAVDFGAISANNFTGGVVRAVGGVFQASGSLTRSLSESGTGFSFLFTGGVNGGGGGFAAKGGDLTVALSSKAKLDWGVTTSFLRDTNLFSFGSNTSDSLVDFQNPIDLGSVTSAVYYREIYVREGTGTDAAQLSGVISSTTEHGLMKSGNGRLILTGENTYTGETAIQKGTLQVGNGGTTGRVLGEIRNDAQLVYNRSDAFTVDNRIFGKGSLRKEGVGTMTLTGTTTYTGTTTVAAGALRVEGALVSSDVVVKSGAALGGFGELRNVTIEGGGKVEQGASYGTLNVASISLDSAASTTLKLGNIADNQVDRIAATGEIDLGGTLTLTFAGAISDFTSVTLFDSAEITGGFTTVVATGFYEGTFLPLGDGSVYLGFGNQFLQFDNGLGTLTVIPEPETYLLLGAALGLLALGKRQSSRKA